MKGRCDVIKLNEKGHGPQKAMNPCSIVYFMLMLYN